LRKFFFFFEIGKYINRVQAVPSYIQVQENKKQPAPSLNNTAIEQATHAENRRPQRTGSNAHQGQHQTRRHAATKHAPLI
jgi:hypothetical protein